MKPPRLFEDNVSSVAFWNMCSIVFTLIIMVIGTSNILPGAFIAVLLLTCGAYAVRAQMQMLWRAWFEFSGFHLEASISLLTFLLSNDFEIFTSYRLPWCCLTFICSDLHGKQEWWWEWWCCNFGQFLVKTWSRRGFTHWLMKYHQNENAETTKPEFLTNRLTVIWWNWKVTEKGLEQRGEGRGSPNSNVKGRPGKAWWVCLKCAWALEPEEGFRSGPSHFLTSWLVWALQNGECQSWHRGSLALSSGSPTRLFCQA